MMEEKEEKFICDIDNCGASLSSRNTLNRHKKNVHLIGAT